MVGDIYHEFLSPPGGVGHTPLEYMVVVPMRRMGTAIDGDDMYDTVLLYVPGNAGLLTMNELNVYDEWLVHDPDGGA